MPNTKKQKVTLSGFTLVEVAIVLGITGVVLGSIWTAASSTYSQRIATDLMQEIMTFQQNARAQFSTTSVTNAADRTDNDSCGAQVPCGTSFMLQTGTFESDLVDPSHLMSGASWGLPTIFVTKYGFPIWTAIENSESYAQQDGLCGVTGQPACATGTTVVEVDFFSITIPTCSYLLMQLINSKVDGLLEHESIRSAYSLSS